MKIIRKGKDGTLWIFSESKKGWIRPEENDGDFDPGDLLSELIKEKINEKKDLSYGLAFSEVQRENPNLARRYSDQIRAKR